MAGLEGAALGAAVSLGLGAYNATSGFSARHDHAHDAQVAETRKLVDDFEKLRKSGDMADEDYDMYLERKDIAIQSSKAYRDSISDFKSTGLLNPIKKWRKRKEVRKRKRQAREANQNLNDHYYDSSSCSSDASSITAESGSPPQSQDIREWADEISEKDYPDDEEDWKDSTGDEDDCKDGSDGGEGWKDSTDDEENWKGGTDDEEDRKDYHVGGYHPVEIGDLFSDGRYVVVGKLGWGHLSTVWLAKDQKMDRHVALKIIKSARRYRHIALTQIRLLQRLLPMVSTSSNPNSTQPHSQTHPGRKHLVSFFDHFRHEGPNGIHVCIVFEVFGENLLDLIKRQPNRYLPMPFVKQIAKQILLGLDYMHRFCGVIHTDLKPENILIYIGNVESIIPESTTLIDLQSDESSEVIVEKVTVKIANLENSTWVEHHLKNDIQTRQYRCPEVILGAKWGPSSDFWSVACVLFELITGDHLFNPSGTGFGKDVDHITQIIELLGDIPRSLAMSARMYARTNSRSFNLKQFKHINILNEFPLEHLLRDKYSFPRVQADALATFFEAMLHLDPKKRANTSDLIYHDWLEGIFIQSEIDIIRGKVQHEVKEESTSLPEAAKKGKKYVKKRIKRWHPALFEDKTPAHAACGAREQKGDS